MLSAVRAAHLCCPKACFWKGGGQADSTLGTGTGTGHRAQGRLAAAPRREEEQQCRERQHRTFLHECAERGPPRISKDFYEEEEEEEMGRSQRERRFGDIPHPTPGSGSGDPPERQVCRCAQPLRPRRESWASAP